jgi:hypothetical protein
VASKSASPYFATISQTTYQLSQAVFHLVRLIASVLHDSGAQYCFVLLLLLSVLLLKLTFMLSMLFLWLLFVLLMAFYKLLEKKQESCIEKIPMFVTVLSILLRLLTREDWTDTLSRNVGKQLPHDAS